MPRRRSLSSQLFRAARITDDAEAVASRQPPARRPEGRCLMASLHARHSRKCALAARSGPGRGRRRLHLRADAITWPAVTSRESSCGSAPARNKRNAVRAHRQDRGSRSTRVITSRSKTSTFSEWGPQWLDALQRKGTTVNGYRSTIAYADGRSSASKPVRQLGASDIAPLQSAPSCGPGPPAGRERRPPLRTALGLHAGEASAGARRLPQLGDPAPVRREQPRQGTAAAEKPRPQRKESAYFTDEELPRLFARSRRACSAALPAALKTGMREGELSP